MSQRPDTCGCSPSAAGPAGRPDNAPGLDRVAYRVARYPASLRRLVAGLADPGRAAQLAALTTRERDDPAMGLLDATAVVADILSFYSERIANEAYLRTATERRSVLELGREIGYELGPGLAAEAWLAFGVEDRGVDPSQPARAVVPAGTRIQSVPAGGGRPQTFETRDELLAEAAWNELRLVTTVPQAVTNAAQTIYLAGTATGVSEGDVLLLAIDPAAPSPHQPGPRIVHRVVVEGDRQRTRVELATVAQPAEIMPAPVYQAGSVKYGVMAQLSQGEADATVGQMAWSEEGLASLLEVYGWDQTRLAVLYGHHVAATPDLGPADPGVFAFKFRPAVFGHNAPKYSQLSSDMHAAYAKDWDAAATNVNITTDSQGNVIGSSTVRLDTTYKLAPGSWVVLATGSPDTGNAYRIGGFGDTSLADFAIASKVTELSLKTPAGGNATDLSQFTPRSTTVYAGSQRLALADVPLPDTLDAGATTLDLDRLVPGLAIGRPIAISGERADLPGIRDTEVVAVSAIAHAGGRTSLTLGTALRNPYLRASVSINANIVRASHGETIAHEVLGSGNAAADQRFRLRRPPVTYTSAATGTGAQSSLVVRVDGVTWSEADTLEDAGPRDERYLVRRDDDGTSTVVFGDGVNGARPPTGSENVTAAYRTGIGLDGMVLPRSLTLIATRPPGVRDVTNPLAAEGAEDPETRDGARVNAPLTVTTLGRVVALSDYEDFARAYGGIGKALATDLWRGERRVVHLTIAGPGGLPVPTETTDNLQTSLDDARDPGIRVEIAGFVRILVRVRVDVLTDPALDPRAVAAAAKAALGKALAFERRAFAAPLTEADVLATVMGVRGVRDSRLLALHQVIDGAGEPAQLRQDPILARPARWVGSSLATAPAELVLLEPTGAIVEVRAQ